jgi:cytochrome P450
VSRAIIFNKEIKDVIQKRKDDLIEGKGEGNYDNKGDGFEDLLTILMKQHIKTPKEVTFDEIIHEFVLLYFAGMDTKLIGLP